MAKDIMQQIRDVKANIKQLLPGQIALATDTDEVFIGNGDGNKNIPVGGSGLGDSCIKTEYIENGAVTEDKLADEVKEKLNSSGSGAKGSDGTAWHSGTEVYASDHNVIVQVTSLADAKAGDYYLNKGNGDIYKCYRRIGNTTEWTYVMTLNGNAADAVTVDSELSETSENPVQNKVIKAALDAIPSITVDSGLSKTSANPVQNKVITKALEAIPTITVDRTLDKSSANPIANMAVVAAIKSIGAKTLEISWTGFPTPYIADTSEDRAYADFNLSNMFKVNGETSGTMSTTRIQVSGSDSQTPRYVIAAFDFDTGAITVTSSPTAVESGMSGNVWTFTLCYYTVGVVNDDDYDSPTYGEYIVRSHSYDYSIPVVTNNGSEYGYATKTVLGGGSGSDGVGISKISKITNNTGSGAANTIRVTLTDNTTHDFTVNNGAKGDKGNKGDKGDKGDAGESGVVNPITRFLTSSNGYDTLNAITAQLNQIRDYLIAHAEREAAKVFINSGSGMVDVILTPETPDISNATFDSGFTLSDLGTMFAIDNRLDPDGETSFDTLKARTDDGNGEISIYLNRGSGGGTFTIYKLNASKTEATEVAYFKL